MIKMTALNYPVYTMFDLLASVYLYIKNKLHQIVFNNVI
jgi:hypothetical protein